VTAPGPDSRSAIVTGAASGIGRAVAERLLRDGARVTAVDRAPRAADTTVPLDDYIQGDVADPSVQSGLAASSEPLDFIVNAAGVIRVGEIDTFGSEDWEAIFRVNVTAPFFLIQSLLPRLRDGGSIVNVASMAGKMSDDLSAAYSASKAALASITRAFATRLGPRGIRVNAISPGIILTPMQNEFLEFYASRSGQSQSEFQESRFRTVPLRRGGTAEECAAVIAFLLSEEASYITGADINVTGGLVTW
jgi:NAD(P)-dependent dehydrogenase (short-subunit alcohol dehydrogenase family)